MKKAAIAQKSDARYKDSFFQVLYHNQARAIELSNALEDANFPIDTPVEFFSLGDKSLARHNNDLAFIINRQLLWITDHQGTINPNMPLRLLPIVADIIYSWLKDKRLLYRSSLLTIPTPKFYVLYNGKEKLKNRVLRLSDAFRYPNHEFSIEIEVKVIDINYGSGDIVLEKSPTLNGYAYLIDRIRHNINAGNSRDRAIEAAVNQCIRENILGNFLSDHYKEVCNMFVYGITYEEEMEVRAEEAMEKGLEKGLRQGLNQGLHQGLNQGLENGLLEAACKFMQNGTSLADVIRILGLSDSQVQVLEKQFA